jgi:hypothetical protein
MKAYTAFGESKSVMEWVRDPRCRVKKTTLWKRLADKERCWTVEEAISTPPLLSLRACKPLPLPPNALEVFNVLRQAW